MNPIKREIPTLHTLDRAAEAILIDDLWNEPGSRFDLAVDARSARYDH